MVLSVAWSSPELGIELTPAEPDIVAQQPRAPFELRRAVALDAVLDTAQFVLELRDFPAQRFRRIEVRT